MRWALDSAFRAGNRSALCDATRVAGKENCSLCIVLVGAVSAQRTGSLAECICYIEHSFDYVLNVLIAHL